MTLDLIAFQKALAQENLENIIDFVKYSPHKRKFIEYYNDKGDYVFHIIARIGRPSDLEILKSAHPNAMAAIERRNNKGETGLHLACQRQDFAMVKAFIDNQAQIVVSDKEGNLPLHVAASHNSYDIALLLCEEGKRRNQQLEQSYLPSFLLEAKFNVHAKNNTHQNPYRIARTKDHQAVMQLLAKHGGQDNYEIAKNYLLQNKTEDFEKYIKQHPYVLKDKNEQGETLLHCLIMCLNSDEDRLIQIMLKLGADINCTNNEGQTPLHYLSMRGYHHSQGTTLLTTLLNMGAKINQPCVKGLIALHYAVAQDNLYVIDFLIQRGANLNWMSRDGIQPLHMAALCQKNTAFKHLIEKYKANIFPKANPIVCALLEAKENPVPVDVLWIAVFLNNQDMVKYIVDYLVKKNDVALLKDIKLIGQGTLIHYFVTINSLEYFKKLVEVGCNPFIPDAQGYTPLHIAAKLGHKHIVYEIVKNRKTPGFLARTFTYTFDVNSETSDGKTALMLSDEHGHKRISRFLRISCRKLLKKESPKGVLARVNDEMEFAKELAQTRGYQLTNNACMLIPTAASFVALGPFAAAGTLVTQFGLYAAPQLVHQYGATVYYPPKVFLHNHAHWAVEMGWDFLSHVPSLALSAMQVYDLFKNPYRRIAGSIASHGTANLSALLTQNKDAQGAMFAMGRQVGYWAVDAYQQYGASVQTPDSTQQQYNEQTIQSLTIWSSLLGKENAQSFISATSMITDLCDSVRQTVGSIEHSLVDGIGAKVKEIVQSVDGLQLLIQGKDAVNDILGSYQSYFSRPLLVCAAMKGQLQYTSDLVDNALFSIEKMLHENLIPESDYKQYAIGYLLKTKVGLLSNKLQEKLNAQNVAQAQLAQSNAKLTELMDTVANEAEFVQAMCEYHSAKLTFSECEAHAQAARASFEQCQQQFQEVWTSTPKGALQANLNAALEQDYSARLEMQALEVTASHFEEVKEQEQSQTYQEKIQAAKLAQQLAKENVQKSITLLQNELTTFEKKHLEERLSLYEKNSEEQLANYRQSTLTLLNDTHLYDEMLSQMTALQQTLVNFELTISSLDAQLEHVNKILYSLAHPGAFIVKQVVTDALRSYKTAFDVSDYIISHIVASGVISLEEAQARMTGSFSSAYSSSNRAQKLEKTVLEHWNKLQDDYKLNYLAQQADLKKQITVAKEGYQVAQNESSALLTQVSQQYVKVQSALPDAQKSEFAQSQLDNQQQIVQHIWQSKHPQEQVKIILSLVGQPEYADYYAHHENVGYSPSALSNFKPVTIANWLLSYKYLFVDTALGAQSVEIAQLSQHFRENGLTIQNISQAKKDIDATIAQNILSVSSTANDVSGALQRVLGSGSVNSSNFDLQSLAHALGKGDSAVASEIVQSTLNSVAKAQSIETFGTWVGQAYPTNQGMAYTGENERHGFTKLFHHPGNTLKEAAKVFLNNGVSVNVNQDGVHGGLTGGNMLPLYQFNKVNSPLFEINRTSLVDQIVRPPIPVGTPLSSIPLPSVLPQPTWMPSVVPYMTSDQFQVVPSMTESTQAYLSSQSSQAVVSSEYSFGSTRWGACWRPAEPAPIANTTSASVVVESEPPSLVSRLGTAALGLLVKEAQANPIAAAQLMTGAQVAAGGATAANSQRWEGDDELQDQSTRLPVHVEDLSRYLGGQFDDNIDSKNATNTLVEQPKPTFDPYTKPLGTNAGIILTQGLLNLYRKADKEAGESLHKPDPDKRYIQKPNTLPGFPEAKRADPGTPYSGGLRPRWKLPNGKILEWDSQHGELEMYDKRGKHLGAFDFNTGMQIKDKKPSRNIKKYL
ncbi:MAG: ankyrin repeat domain-containing protein [Candidatus Berkiella sp.]